MILILIRPWEGIVGGGWCVIIVGLTQPMYRVVLTSSGVALLGGFVGGGWLSVAVHVFGVLNACLVILDGSLCSHSMLGHVCSTELINITVMLWHIGMDSPVGVHVAQVFLPPLAHVRTQATSHTCISTYPRA